MQFYKETDLLAGKKSKRGKSKKFKQNIKKNEAYYQEVLDQLFMRL